MKNPNRLLRLLMFLSVFLFIFDQSGYAQQKQNWITAKNGEEIGFYEYVPANYKANPTLKYPVIIFLHGHGERGDGRSQLSNVLLGGTPPRLIADGNPMTFTWNGKTESFIVISPQLNSKYGWWQNWYIDELLAYAAKTYRIDPDRIFLTGLSMGGGGTWQYAGASVENAKKFAAIGVSCGACTSIDRCNLAKANLPVWAFHAKDDSSPAPYSCTAGTIDAIRACKPAVDPYFTTWETGEHWIWGRVYDPEYNWQNPNLYEWFLAQNRSLPVNQRPVIVAPDVTVTSSVATTVLDASKSTDADGKILRYVWRKVSGPGNGTLSALYNTDGKVTVTDLVNEGTYVYEVKVIDDRADWTIKNITVTVVPGAPGSKRPVADAGADFTVFYPSTSSQLNGKNSYDPDGNIVGWTWSLVKGPTAVSFTNGNTSTPTVNGLGLGTYTFKLVVTDNNGISDDDEVVVTVSPANILPVAKAGADIYLTLPTNTTTLDGSSSYDSDGELKAYEWSYISGPAKYKIVSPTSVKSALTDLEEGTYEFKLRVWDNWYNSTNDTIKVFVGKDPAPVNRPPVADAGPDRTITLPIKSTTLDGSKSADPDNNITSYQWIKISGPAAHDIANSTAASTTVDNLEEGTYEFQLTVKDAEGLSSTDVMTITVKVPMNLPPVANAGPDRNITLPLNTTTLDGSASSDPEGQALSYEWSWVSGPAVYDIGDKTAVITGINALVQGTYQFKLKVTDKGGLSSEALVNVIVNPVLPPDNKPPVANAGADFTVQLPNNGTLDGKSSSDIDGSIAKYEWTLVKGAGTYTIANKNAASTQISALVAGTYEFKLTVTDNGGLTSSDNVVVTVKPIPNKPPVANAGTDITLQLPANTAKLDGSLSTDPESKPLTYEWSYVNGPTPYSIANKNAAVTNVSALTDGTYQFKLTVTDEGGLSASDIVQITVKPLPPNKLPIANAGADFTVFLPNPVIKLDGRASNDPDGSIVSYKWTRIKGPGTVTISGDATAQATVANAIAGVHEFELVVKDNRGGIDKDTVAITVKEKPNVAPKANAGKDITIYVPTSSVKLDGSESTDSDGRITLSQWRQIGGPEEEATIVEPSGLRTEVNRLGVGIYLFELMVVDDKGGIGKDTVQVEVINNFKSDENFAVYPNPTINGTVYLRCISDTRGEGILKIYDVNGRLMKAIRVPRSQSVTIQTISVADLLPGIYYLDFIIGNQKRMHSKLMKR
ncbi:T9SS type A sorting domain-containing protein [Pseudoflavitalea sp. G-6-1-2]|uniref:PKD domain-containing protein n=1 Tax=Pseudoflavitalea sp. G-6-1-2 TaxID=2728841 RepID=UPI00146C72EA|nr:PKD domain-containing protein [Pseudoflavitalea sp. G-6-1-2]NML19343.1 T9SS type A sorting domain-containing protein [Pseudoflavitalea sp. G-6-1-2]